jgi:prephenate dehydrogenase
MSLFKKVAIVGTGLIGGSIGLAIKKERLAQEVVGVSRHKKNLALAKKRGAIDRGSQDIDIVKNADLVVLATPVDTIMSLAPKIPRLIADTAVVTDVGSTKKEIVAALGKLFPGYVGSHPLAGLEKRSIVYACAGLFRNTLCVLTPTRKTDRQAMAKVKTLWQRIGARIVLLSPAEHDKILSLVSHLPHAAAFSLIASIPENYLKFAATGLKDTTRIAVSDSRLWTEVFLSNKRNLVKDIELLRENLAKLKSAIKKDDREGLVEFLKRATKKRESLGS